MVSFTLEKIAANEAKLALSIVDESDVFELTSILGQGVAVQDPVTLVWSMQVGNLLGPCDKLFSVRGLRGYLAIAPDSIYFCFDPRVRIESITSRIEYALSSSLKKELVIHDVDEWSQLKAFGRQLLLNDLKFSITTEEAERSAVALSVSLMRQLTGQSYSAQVDSLALMLQDLYKID